MDFREILGTSNKRRLRLIELMYYSREGLPSERILNELECSLPILLNDISLINELQDNFIVEKVKGLYRVKLKDDVSIGKLYSEALTTAPEFQIMEQLLFESCDNISELSSLLFLSTSNIQRYLKKIEPSLNKAGILLLYRPLRLEGKESVIRHFFYRYFIEKQYTLKYSLPEMNDDQIQSIEKFIIEFTKINHLAKKHIFHKRLTYSVFISLWRIKNGHHYAPEELRTQGLLLPEKERINDFSRMIRLVFNLRLTDEIMRDCLWVSFSDSIVFSREHREAALSDNPRYTRLFNAHLELTERFTKLLGVFYDKQRLLELTTVLVNDVYLYDEDGEFLTILRKSRTVFLEMVKLMHRFAVEKVTRIVEEFVQENKMYQQVDFITNYVYLLLTEEVDTLELLASQDKTIHLLLLSDLSPTEEKFISKVLKQIVYGNFEIHHFEDVWEGSKDVFQRILSYDGLITTGSIEGLPKDFPLVSMDPYVTPQAIVSIQNLVNEISERSNYHYVGEKKMIE
ncbi:Mga helix-turn-helix domain-containing protein [Enterococcus malodoratus]|uniref:helix-turn-helix domain-containing protein n=1 Tax=Enterococcus malodoratus TaxID=71451 RepID=UPI0008CE70DD|nr:helix-turn-helix domain-containing protein [Enterococcus malodoratus]SET76098.1 Mga helix-turn-helix domain-containing protein [Enterococcus malodoratus]